MEENYDYIILGTGYKECLLSGLLSYSGRKVLHIDRNPFYGMDTATITLKEAYQHFKMPSDLLSSKKDLLGDTRIYSIDLCPKFVLASGNMFRALIATGVDNYMKFSAIEGTFVYINKTLSKVPISSSEAITSSLLGFMQKNRLRIFLSFVYKISKPYKELGNKSAKKLMDEYSLDKKTQALVYHVLALNVHDKEINKNGSAISLVEKVKLYERALGIGKKSPFLYPLYGLGMLPEGFSRLSAVYKGVYMLNKPFDKLIIEENSVKGIISNDEKAFAPTIIANCSYFNEYSDKFAKVARYLLIVSSLPNFAKKRKISSFQCIIPGIEFGRNNAVYVTFVSNNQKVTPKGKYLLTISCIIEKDNGELKKQLEKFVIPIFFEENWEDYVVEKFYEEKFMLKEKENNEIPKGLFLINSVDASSHFEGDSDEIFKIYEKITETNLDLKNISRDDLKN